MSNDIEVIIEDEEIDITSEIECDFLKGQPGKSAYEAAVEAGFTGTEEELNIALAAAKQIADSETQRNNAETSRNQAEVIRNNTEISRNQAEVTRQTETTNAINNCNDAKTNAINVANEVTNAKNNGDFDASEIVNAEFINDDIKFTKQDNTSFNLTNARIILKGAGFSIAKIYTSVTDMLDSNGTDLSSGDFVVIDTGDINDPDNAKMYLWNGVTYSFLCDLSGSQGIQGIGIASIVKTNSNELIDTYTITLTNNSTTSFTVTNGEKGDTGKGITSVQKTSTNGLVDTYTITFDDNTTTNFNVTNARSIDGIDKTNTNGLIDTYTITFNNGTTKNFNVTNGKSITSVEKISTDGLIDTYTITFNDDTTINFSVANGEKGDKGDNIEVIEMSYENWEILKRDGTITIDEVTYTYDPTTIYHESLVI